MVEAALVWQMGLSSGRFQNVLFAAVVDEDRVKLNAELEPSRLGERLS